jgi:amidase
MTDQKRRDIPTEMTESATGSSVAVNSIPGKEWAYSSAKDLVDALQTKKVSASELVKYVIARIEILDRCVNAVVVRDFERAREAATLADTFLARGETRPLLGVPITIKEAFNVTGLPTTWGFPQFKDFVPTEDAVAVARAKCAGAIVLGKTNVPAGLADFQSYNSIYGTTNNPWDKSRSPGGSSGGSAAALAAGFGPLSLGSDIGGSLRVPAHFCGVYAHKPSFGLVPFRGYGLPPSPPLPHEGDLAVIGPMARTAADLTLLLDVIAGPDEENAGVGYKLALPPTRHTNLGDFRVLVIDTQSLMPTNDAVRAAIGHLADRLAKEGAKVGHSSPFLPNLIDSARLYRTLLGAAKSVGMPLDRYEESQHIAAGLAPEDRSLGAEHLRGTVVSHRDWLMADMARSRMQQQWRRLFHEWDVVLYPPASTLAFPHDHSLPIESRYLMIDDKKCSFYDAFFTWADPVSTCGLPATTAPIGLSPDGLPIGVQIIGPYLEDRTPIAFAELIEREFGGFVPPPGYAG